MKITKIKSSVPRNHRWRRIKRPGKPTDQPAMVARCAICGSGRVLTRGRNGGRRYEIQQPDGTIGKLGFCHGPFSMSKAAKDEACESKQP